MLFDGGELKDDSTIDIYINNINIDINNININHIDC